MTLLEDRPNLPGHAAETTLMEIVPGPRPRGFVKYVTSTDHKQIGLNYIVTALIGFLFAGALAELIRTQLIVPDNHFITPNVYNQAFTIHGTIMLFVFVGPFAFAGLGNYLVPLMIGAPDMAFPRFNNLSYWLYLGGFILLCVGFLTNNGAAEFGWFGYAPLTEAVRSPGPGADLWLFGVGLTGFSGIFSAVNIITTIFTLRAPGMVMFRMPIFVWNILVTMFLILLAFPVLTSAFALLWIDRHLGGHFFDAALGGQPILWQNMFWFFGHPEVYIIALPYFGVVTEVIATMSRKPVFGYKGMIGATLSIGALSMGVWAHHMYTTGAVLLPFFAAVSLLISVPTGIKFFNWIGTMWRGTIVLNTAMLFCIGFLIQFLLGGITGVMLAQPVLDFQVHNTYFVVAHFHYVIMGLLSGAFAGIYYWYPKMTGRLMNETVGKISCLLMITGFNLTFFPQHTLGLRGMPRRIEVYNAGMGWNFLNMLSSIGAYVTGVGVLITVWNMYRSFRKGEIAGDNPWDAQTLEWACSSPPPDHNFEALPPIRSERPVWDANHPDMLTKVGH
jgi:cytochrome c oxidase subunit 1